MSFRDKEQRQHQHLQERSVFFLPYKTEKAAHHRAGLTPHPCLLASPQPSEPFRDGEDPSQAAQLCSASPLWGKPSLAPPRLPPGTPDLLAPAICLLSSHPASPVQRVLPSSPPFSSLPPFPKHRCPGWASCSWAVSPAPRVEFTNPALCVPLHTPSFGVCISHDCRLPVAPALPCPRHTAFPHHPPDMALGPTFQLSRESSSASDFKNYGWKGPLDVTSPLQLLLHACPVHTPVQVLLRPSLHPAVELTVHCWHWAQ